MNRVELIARLQSLEVASGITRRPGGAGPAEVQRQTEAALRDSEERLRAILETAVEGIITIDERGLIAEAAKIPQLSVKGPHTA